MRGPMHVIGSPLRADAGVDSDDEGSGDGDDVMPDLEGS